MPSAHTSALNDTTNKLTTANQEHSVSTPLTLFRCCAPDQVEWLSPDGQLQSASFTAFAAHVGQAPLLLVVPGEMATLHYMPLPGRRRSLWARAAPYALEDQLIDDVDNLHFALAATAQEERIALITVQHQTMRDWLAACAAHQLLVQAVIPDVLLLPWQEDAWTIVRDAQRLLIRTGRWSGFVSALDTWAWFSGAALATAPAPQRICAVGDLPALPFAAQLETLPDQHLLQICAAGYQSASAINLMQGQYAPQTAWQRWLYPWRFSAALVALLLLVQGAMLLYQQQQLQREHSALRSAMEQLYKAAVPGATRIVNPRVQLEGRWRELLPNSKYRGSAFFALLEHSGQALVAFPTVTLVSLDYRAGQLDLALQGGDPATLDQLRQRLQQPGFSVEMRTTQQAGTSTSTVSLRREQP